MAGSRDVDEHAEEWPNADSRMDHSGCLLASRPSPRRRAPAQLTSKDLERLARTVEAEIIPRLLLAHTLERGAVTAAEQSHGAPTDLEIETFTGLLLRRDAREGLAYTRALGSRGVHTEDLMLGLLAPAARMLGEYWKEDVCDFTEVTVALSRLQQILREINPLIDADRSEREGRDMRPHARRRLAFLVAAPGEQHSFGLSVVEEFFRREDWDVWGGVALSSKKIVELVRSNHFDLIGFSLSCELFLDQLASTIRAVRKASRNSRLIVMVGGQLFITHPEFVARVGADATAVDGQQAVENAQKLAKGLELRDADAPGRS